LRHEQLQLGHRRQVIDWAAQVAHAAGTEHGLLDLQHATRIAAVGIQVDGREHTAVGAANGKRDMNRAQQFVPEPDLLWIVRLTEAHQGELGQDDVVRQRFTQLAIDPTFVGRKHRSRRQGPLGRQWRDPWLALARQPPSDRADQRNQEHDECDDPRQQGFHGGSV